MGEAKTKLESNYAASSESGLIIAARASSLDVKGSTGMVWEVDLFYLFNVEMISQMLSYL